MSTGSSSSDRKREAKAHGLLQSLYSGMYPEFTGMEGPTDDTDPKDNSAPPKGSYNSCSSGGNNYFVFHDRKVVSFVTNVFPQSMKGLQGTSRAKIMTTCSSISSPITACIQQVYGGS